MVDCYLSSSLICHLLAISRQNFYWHRKAMGECKNRMRMRYLNDRAEYGLYHYPLEYALRLARRVRNEAARDFERNCELFLRRYKGRFWVFQFSRFRVFEWFVWRLRCGYKSYFKMCEVINEVFAHPRKRKKSVADLRQVLKDRMLLRQFYVANSGR